MKQINTEIEIAAAPAVVWQILTELDEFKNWNPFVVDANGEAVVGEKLVVSIQPPGKRAQTFRPTVTVADPERKFEWLGKLGIAGVFDGRHQYVLEPTAEGTKFIQREEFTGVLAGLLIRMIGKATGEGFEAMNHALKARAEATVSERG
ncbi:MAG: SRPBCC domain-containing protein [Acidimicrobiia bacterium]|nr:SRPBCC domain-containing protein [Acidimicrobiia bacterium]